MLYMKSEGEVSEFDGSEVLIFPLTIEELKFLYEDKTGFEKYINLQYDGGNIKDLLKGIKFQMQEKYPSDWIYNTCWLVVSLVNKNIVGTISFKGCPQNGRVEICYEIGKNYQNRGYGTIAVELICNFAKNNEIKVVKANCLNSNIASQKVLSKNNFRIIKEDNSIIYFEKEIL